ncbi:DUF4153 domain-containing protein [Candidatus Nomurabacteria bacterium]|nr:DUF4153 domain-containing protein [Candidatus Nomurabacteria bacterium]
MNKFKRVVLGIVKRGGLAFTCFPASMALAVILAGLYVWLVYAEPESNERLWTSLQIALISASVAGIALSALARVFREKSREFVIANVATVVWGGIAFVLLIFVKGIEKFPETKVVIWVLGIALASLFTFLVIPTFRERLVSYNDMFFMTIKSFFIAFLYSGVLMAGFSFVAFAVERLLWDDMDEKVYLYILIGSLLIGYTFFLGYFPDFRKKDPDEYSERALKAADQPRFAEVLFQNIMIPIVAALSVVLLVWSVKIVITGDWPSFTQIAGIFTAYTLSSVALYLLVSSYDTKLVKFYKKFNPAATLVFLGFEIYPIYERIAAEGLKVLEYVIVVLWVFAAVCSVCFLLLPVVKNRVVSYVAAVLILLMMLPGTGLIDAPFYAQSARLRSVLVRNEMLDGDSVVPDASISDEDKAIITSVANYLYYNSERDLPGWLADELIDMKDFKKVFGFDEFFGDGSGVPGKPSEYFYLNLGAGALNVEGYTFFIPGQMLVETAEVSVGSGDGSYVVKLSDEEYGAGGKIRIPSVQVTVKGGDVFVVSLEDLVDEIYAEYVADEGNAGAGSQKSNYTDLSEDELSVVANVGGTNVKVILRSIEFYISSGDVEQVNVQVYGVCVE